MFGFQHSLRNAGGGGAEAEARSSISPLFNSRGSLRFSREVIMLHSQVGASLLRNPLFPGRFFLFFFLENGGKPGLGVCHKSQLRLFLSLSLFLQSSFSWSQPQCDRPELPAPGWPHLPRLPSFRPGWNLCNPQKGKKKKKAQLE